LGFKPIPGQRLDPGTINSKYYLYQSYSGSLYIYYKLSVSSDYNQTDFVVGCSRHRCYSDTSITVSDDNLLQILGPSVQKVWGAILCRRSALSSSAGAVLIIVSDSWPFPPPIGGAVLGALGFGIFSSPVVEKSPAVLLLSHRIDRATGSVVTTTQSIVYREADSFRLFFSAVAMTATSTSIASIIGGSIGTHGLLAWWTDSPDTKLCLVM
jgi:hypothetical protein